MPWMAVRSLAQSPAVVSFTHRGIVAEHCVRVGDECYVSLAFLDAVGWRHEAKGEEVNITVGGKSVQVGVRDIGGDRMIPLRFAMDKLGGDTSWDGSRLTALSNLTKVEIKSGEFLIETALPIHPKVFTLTDPKRIVVDLEGAKLTSETKVDLDGVARISQFKPSVVRVVLESGFDDQIGKRTFDPGSSFDFTVFATATNPDSKEQTAVDTVSTSKPDKNGPRVPLTQPQKIVYDPASDPDMAPPPVVHADKVLAIGPLLVDSESPKSTILTLKVVGKPVAPTIRRPDPDSVEVFVPGAEVAGGIDSSTLRSQAIQSVTARQESGGTTLALALARPMGVEVSQVDGDLRIQLIRPSVGDGRLAGKVVVVDPGHGGHDSGTQASGYREKDFTLAIGTILGQKLIDEGATVIMTRTTDVFVPLDDRPALANRNHADFFISVHINSNELDDTASGTITFYHSQDPICQLMADCIEREVVKVNGIGGMGTWSDTKVHHSGFAVLRGAKMPAVLIECGFLNTAKDRAKMLTDDFKIAVASGIVKGLKDYLGDADTQEQRRKVIRK